MPLHDKEAVRDSFADDVYASADLSVSMPKYKISAQSTFRVMPTPSCMTN